VAVAKLEAYAKEQKSFLVFSKKNAFLHLPACKRDNLKTPRYRTRAAMGPLAR
jgi:hypothetical protein